MYRIRMGSLRIVYQVLWDKRTIIIHHIGSRGKASEEGLNGSSLF